MIGMSVCSGIGAPELSAPWIDWRYQSEIEPFPCAVLKHRFPDAINLGDMTKFKEWPDANVDVLCGEYIFDRIRLVEGLTRKETP